MGCPVHKNEVSIADGATFVVSDSIGDIVPTNGHGFFRSDTRFLSAFTVSLNGASLRPLSAGATGHHTAKFYATNPDLDGAPAGTLALVRERRVNDHLCEIISIANHGLERADLALDITVQADFADIFEVHSHSMSAPVPRARLVQHAHALRFDFKDSGLRWSTLIRTSTPGQIDGATLRFLVSLAPRETWSTQIDVEPYLTERVGARMQASSPRQVAVRPAAIPEPVVATLESRFTPLARAYERSLIDLQTLRVAHPSGHTVPAAGLPWFMAVFGRDALITALQTLIVDPTLAYGALRALSAYQAHEDDPFRDAEPGKIPHEIRHGRLSHRGKVPHSRYYGTADATPLFLTTLAETVRWTGDIDLAHEMLSAANEALAWIDHFGDLDGDGFVEYQRRSRQGLKNQGWKDSHDSINFANGRPAEGPIALCEVQGYVYQAKTGMAWLFRELGDHDRAATLAAEAALLRRRFNDAFWIEETGILALGLDGDKRPIDAVASNMGHCLWSGIVDRDKAAHVARRLLADDMFSGWGIRTLSSEMAVYNPISYHNGSIWPHDNAIIAAGLVNYGFRQDASRVIRGVMDAAGHFPLYRLPELFAGFSRGDDDFPVEYPQANAPQAWAAGTIILMAQSWLGVSLGTGGPRTRPLPGAPSMRWSGIRYRNQHVQLSSSGRTAAPSPHAQAS